MNLCKSKIIKSEAIRIVAKKEDLASGGDDSDSPGPLNNARTARQRLEDAICEAYEKGVSEGMKLGRDLERRESVSVLKAAEDAVGQTGRLRASIIERSEDDILALVFAVAEKVIHHEVTVNPNIVAGVLKRAVEAINDKEHIRVRCNPGDLAVLQNLRPELPNTTDDLRGMEFVEDPSIVSGGVRIETGDGEVDARLDRQFEVIKNAVLS
jgi:flagellar assembly protein FliH